MNGTFYSLPTGNHGAEEVNVRYHSYSEKVRAIHITHCSFLNRIHSQVCKDWGRYVHTSRPE